jgi:hypothetical protein
MERIQRVRSVLLNDMELIQDLLNNNRKDPIWTYFDLQLDRLSNVLTLYNTAIQIYGQRNSEKNSNTDLGNPPMTFFASLSSTGLFFDEKPGFIPNITNGVKWYLPKT